jgi:hypothetical protein
MLPSSTMPILLLTLVAIAILKPKLLRRIFGHVEPKQLIPRAAAVDPVAAETFDSPWRPPVPGRQDHRPAVKEFGRRKA